MKSKADKLIFVRLIIQVFCFAVAAILLALILINRNVSAHEYCPYAVICFGMNRMGFIKLTQALFAFAIVGGFGILVATIFWGRKFCGFVCPLGTMQEAIYKFHRKRRYRKNRLPFYMEKRFGILKYILLVITSLLTIKGLAYLYMNYCPIMSFSNIPFLSIRGALVIGMILASGFFVERFWCRYLCPYAALMNIAEWLGKLFKVRRSMIFRNLEKCNDCALCENFCPMNLNILNKEEVDDVNCIHCYMCLKSCPKQAVSNEQI